jgi:hypothetical protein
MPIILPQQTLAYTISETSKRDGARPEQNFSRNLCVL